MPDDDVPKPIPIPMPVLPRSAGAATSSAPRKKRAVKKAAKKRVVRKAAAGLDEEIRELAASRGKIHAIKLYRERTGVGLADAKAAVEAIIG